MHYQGKLQLYYNETTDVAYTCMRTTKLWGVLGVQSLLPNVRHLVTGDDQNPMATAG